MSPEEYAEIMGILNARAQKITDLTQQLAQCQRLLEQARSVAVSLEAETAAP
jgi:hypothetical protein